mmetsp:Transcript_24055/g.63192  ORF Transcript_24055/g.63192 Transcript_24055/m.63192 type:complete len:223 (-) Transcript_24055:437-1105(-)
MGTSPRAACMPSKIASSCPGLEKSSAKAGSSGRERHACSTSSKTLSRRRVGSFFTRCLTANTPAGSQMPQRPREKASFFTLDVSHDPLRTTPRQVVHPSMGTEGASSCNLAITAGISWVLVTVATISEGAPPTRESKLLCAISHATLETVSLELPTPTFTGTRASTRASMAVSGGFISSSRAAVTASSNLSTEARRCSFDTATTGLRKAHGYWPTHLSNSAQ